jgi:hypothetical protein
VANTSWKRFPALLLGLIPLACAHATSASSAEGGSASSPVAFKFAWPDGYKTHVLIAHQSRRRGGEPTAILAHQRMVTEKKGNELWVSTRETAARGNDPDLETTVKINEALVQVVALDGAFVRAEGVDQALAALKPSDGEDRDNTRRALARSTAFDWEVMVGAWAGQTLRQDDAKTKKVKASVPLFAAAETTLDVEYVLEGRVPCTEDDAVRRCVALTYRGRISPDDRAATVERFIKAGNFKKDDPVPEDVHSEVEVQLVTEPDTLVPHRLTQLQRLRVRLRFPDGRVQEADERAEDVSIFTDRAPTEAPPVHDRRKPPPESGSSDKGSQTL